MATTTARAAWRADFGLYRKLVRALRECGLTSWEFAALTSLVRKYSACGYAVVYQSPELAAYYSRELFTLPLLAAVNDSLIVIRAK